MILLPRLGVASIIVVASYGLDTQWVEPKWLGPLWRSLTSTFIDFHGLDTFLDHKAWTSWFRPSMNTNASNHL